MLRNGNVTLAATDRGGTQPTIVLLHGLGGTQRSMAKVADALPGWRVITMDLRGHGKSTTGPWDFTNTTADLDVVIDHFQLERPYVGGHSLGGMVALQYAMAGRDVAGVINIDGWGSGLAARYPGEDLAAVDAYLDQVARAHMPSRLARVLTAIPRQSREGTTREVLAMLDRADTVAWHGAVSCPTLAFNAVAPAGRILRRLVGQAMVQRQHAYRQGLRRDLAELAANCPTLMVVEVDASHRLIKTHPGVVASAIRAFHERTASAS